MADETKDPDERTETMKTETVNLRAAGTDPVNPTAGALVGTADVPVPNERVDLPPVIITSLISSDGSDRIFQNANVLVGFGPAPTAEYVEVLPVRVKATLPPSTTKTAG